MYTAVTAVDWSADGTQIASVERGGMSRIFMLVPAAKPGEKDKKKRAKMKMGETLWLVSLFLIRMWAIRMTSCFVHRNRLRCTQL